MADTVSSEVLGLMASDLFNHNCIRHRFLSRRDTIPYNRQPYAIATCGSCI